MQSRLDELAVMEAAARALGNAKSFVGRKVKFDPDVFEGMASHHLSELRKVIKQGDER